MDLRTREALWYALQEMPVALQLDVLHSACLEEEVGEPSWLIRRAIGSVISSLPAHSRSRRELIVSLLSPDRSWMQNAIGVVAAREDVAHDAELQSEVLRMLHSARLADVIWLAHLYSAEFSPDAALEVVLQTGMVRTRWGLLDIFRRHQGRFRGDLEGLIDRLRHAAHSEGDLDSIRLHLVLSGLDDRVLEDIPVDRSIADSPVARSLYRKRPRGKIRQPKAKWLLSYLYGDWRDQVGDDVVLVLDEVPESQRVAQAMILSNLPAVEMRMALARETAEGFSRANDLAAIHSWASRDVHPWVRRESVSVDDRGISVAAFEPPIDRALYPGALDLAIVGIEAGVMPINFEDHLDLPVFERKALQRYASFSRRSG